MCELPGCSPEGRGLVFGCVPVRWLSSQSCSADCMLRAAGPSGESRWNPTRKPSLKPLVMYAAKAQSGAWLELCATSPGSRGVEIDCILGVDVGACGLAEFRHIRSAV